MYDLPCLTLGKDLVLGNVLLGRGTFANVFRCSLNGEDVAVKLLHPQFQRVGCADEIRILTAAKGHPNIVNIRAVIVSPVCPSVPIGFATELCNRGHLGEFLTSATTFTSENAKSAMKQILSAVHFLHDSLNVLHGDLSFRNVLVHQQPDGQLLFKLADFGCSKFLSACLTAPCAPLGLTPLPIASPELLVSGNASGFAVDIWAAGHLFYLLLTRSFLFAPRSVDPATPLTAKATLRQLLRFRELRMFELRLSHIHDVDARTILVHMMDMDASLRPSASSLLASLSVQSSCCIEQRIAEQPQFAS
jgi:serine/threonine protein kinase